MRVAVLGIKALPAMAGADRVVEHLLESASDEIDYLVYLLSGSETEQACSERIRYVYVPALRGKHLRAASYFFLCCLHVLFKAGSVDVVHVHNSDVGLFVPLLRLKRGTRILGTFHGVPYHRDKWGSAAKAALRVAEALFVRACHGLSSVSAHTRIPGRTVTHIPNGVVDRSMRERTPSPLPIGDDSIVFACGRLDRTKGLHHALEAFAQVDMDVRFFVIGDFTHDVPYADSIAHAAAKDPRVVLHRALLPAPELHDVLHRCRLFVFPSEVEGMSMMLLEAVSCGALVVCSDIPENCDVVGVDYPYLFRSADPLSLAGVLRRAYADAASWDAVPLLAQTRRRFDWERIAEQYEELYATLVREHVPFREVSSVVSS
jgi:glycosyltransferase involved in cell wall biosynthesis